MELVGRDCDILGKTAIGTVTVIIRCQVDVPAVISVDVEVQKPALADARTVHVLPDSGYTPHDIGALDAREGERGLAADGEGSLVAFVLGRVQTLTGLAVGVVLGRGRDANEYLVRAG